MEPVELELGAMAEATVLNLSPFPSLFDT